jgi:magnesium transporter
MSKEVDPQQRDRGEDEERLTPGPIGAPPSGEEEEAVPFDDLVARMQTETMSAPEIAEAVEQQEAADAADTLEDLPQAEAAEVLGEMEMQAAADALAEMEVPLAVSVIEDLVDEGEIGYAGKLIALMASDDAADLLQGMDEKHREGLLAGLPGLQATKLRRLIGYDRESAGGIMTTDFIVLREHMNVAQATDVVRRQTVPDEIHYLPVVDRDERLVGIIGLRTLLIAKPDQRIADLMDGEVDTLTPNMDREEVARAFDRYDYTMMPVVDPSRRLLGVVTFDDIIDIIRREQTEDVQRAVGAGAEEAVYSPLDVKIKSRFPWLLVNLCTSTVAAVVVLQFEDLITELAILAVLMPVIANQAGNAGQQSLAVTLRGIVLDQIRTGRVGPLVAREAMVGAFNGIVGGLLVGGGLAIFSTVVKGASWQLGLVAAIAMAISLSLGCFMGSAMPILIRRLGLDPATGSTIFLTMTTDTMSFVTFLSLARLLSKWLLPV